MEKKLLKFDKTNYLNEVRCAEADWKAYTQLLDNIIPLAKDVGLILNMELLASLLKNAKEVAFDSVVGNNPLTIAGAPVNRKKAMEFIDMPDAWDKIINFIEAFKHEINKNPVHKSSHHSQPEIKRVGLESFDINEGTIVLKSDFVKQIEKKHSIFTTSERQNAALKHITNLHSSIIELKKMGVSFWATSTLEEFGFSQSGGGSEPLEIHLDPTTIVSQIN